MSKNLLTLIMDTNKFNGTNYNDWLRNLRIVLDFENQGYVLDKPLPTALSEGSSLKERLTFDKWLEDNRKEASTSKAKGKRARRWKRKKGKGTAVAATASAEGAPAAPTGKGKGRLGVLRDRGK
ncbi:UNVERIFIED_CONTAM: hypothetical protein Slati_0905400 [Sesamum latifolium]|uniref:Retrotransposon Copia-like N-terminal domain-containing protein n=1 Tax=Sesamum latifolium TaxID=2727402 RepID=A0AAW2XNM1_9LAMI